MRIATLRALGFDLSQHVPFTRGYRVRCSCCAALVINGVPAHESGCTQARHECRGCSALVPVNQRYCEECQ
jgi:hypothetical protein